MAGTAASGKSVVVIQTGQERMSNAVRCLAFMMDLSNQLPKECHEAKTRLMLQAGELFFNDCLMAKMSRRYMFGGYITITTNELRQSFSNAVAQLFTNQIPPALAKELSRPLVSRNNSGLSLQAIYERANEREERYAQHPVLALSDGFGGSFEERNNMHMSVDEQYRQIAQSPELAPSLNALEAAFQQAGVMDADQSDFKEICLTYCSWRTSALTFYGPQSHWSMPEEYQAMTESLDKVLRWRLVNLYGLDEAAAQALVRGLSRVPIDQFSPAGLQVPAWLH